MASDVRISILKMLVEAESRGYCLSVNSIQRSLEVHHSTVIYHLEKLKRLGLVEPIDGGMKKRKIWGLKLENLGFVKEVLKSAQCG